MYFRTKMIESESKRDWNKPGTRDLDMYQVTFRGVIVDKQWNRFFSGAAIIIFHRTVHYLNKLDHIQTSQTAPSNEVR